MSISTIWVRVWFQADRFKYFLLIETHDVTSFCPLGDQYALKLRLVDHVYDDQVIDQLTVKLILPEGAR